MSFWDLLFENHPVARLANPRLRVILHDEPVDNEKARLLAAYSMGYVEAQNDMARRLGLSELHGERVGRVRVEAAYPKPEE